MPRSYPFYLDQIDYDIMFEDSEVIESHPPHPDVVIATVLAAIPDDMPY